MQALAAARTGKHPPPTDPPIMAEIESLLEHMGRSMRRCMDGALQVGLRLLYIRQQTLHDGNGGFLAALEKIEGSVPRSTAYRWLTAASNVLGEAQGVEAAALVKIPAPGTPAWTKADKLMEQATAGMSLRRLLVGSSAISEESRMDALVTAAEKGDRTADRLLEDVAAGKYTLVQAIRALGGNTQKEKRRCDPVYLTLDGRTGEPAGLFPRCLITLANTFRHWEDLDEAARRKARGAWLEVVSNLPRELR